MAESSRATSPSASKAPLPAATSTRAFKPLSLASSANPTSPTQTPSSPGAKKQLRAGRMSSISYSSPRSFTHDAARGKENKEPERGITKTRPLTLVEKHADLLSSIAQKEAKVNEARQELQRHEAELAELRRRWEQTVTQPAQRNHSASISSLPSNASSSSIASASTAPTSVEASSPEVGAVAQLSALVQQALGPDQPISPAVVDTGKRLLGQFMRTVGAGDSERRGSLDVVTEEGEVLSQRAESRPKRLSSVPSSSSNQASASSRRDGLASPKASEDPALWASRAADEGWTKRWDEVLGSDGFQSSKRATINFGSTLSDSIRSVLPVDLFPLPNLSPTPNPQPGQVPATPTPKPKPIRLREIVSSRSVMDDDGEGDGLGISYLPKPLSPARPPPASKVKVPSMQEEEDASWGW